MLTQQEQDIITFVQQNRDRELSAFELLLKKLYYFDWYYDYSDDGRVYRNGVEAQKKLQTIVDSYEGPDKQDLIDCFSSAKRDVVFTKHFITKCFHLLHYENRGILGCYIDGINPVVVDKIKNLLLALSHHIKSTLPICDFPGRFIYNSFTPSVDKMRFLVAKDGFTPYYGISIESTARDHLDAIIQGLNKDMVDVMIKYDLQLSSFVKTAEEGSIPMLIQLIKTPYFDERCQMSISYHTGMEKKYYRFFLNPEITIK